MFTPLSDSNVIRYIDKPRVTWGLILVNIFVYFFTGANVPEQAAQAYALSFGFIPSVVLQENHLPQQLVVMPSVLSLITYQFLHGGFWHLAGNMLFLYIFGDNVEDAMGHRKFLAFYLLCGVIGALAHLAMYQHSKMPLVGASGAISGVMAAYLMLYPKGKIFGLLFGFIPMNLPVWAALGGWAMIQLLNGLGSSANEGQVAFFAHIGGFAAGLVLVRFFKRESVPLFSDRQRLSISVPTVRFKR
jgi:membrane associated rhomboid family serine protease